MKSIYAVPLAAAVTVLWAGCSSPSPAAATSAIDAPTGVGTMGERLADPPLNAFYRESFLARARVLVDSDGEIKPGARARALAQTRELNKPLPGANNNANFAGVWTEGPTDGFGGRMRSLSIDPRDPEIMIAGSVSGGLWRTADGGNNWSPVDDFLPSLAIGAIARSPSNPDLLYAGTGEPVLERQGGSPVNWPFGGFMEAVRGSGIYVSNDNGQSFQPIAGTEGTALDLVYSMKVMQNGDVLVGTVAGLFRTTDGFTSFTNTSPGMSVLDIDVHPTLPNVAAATYQSAGTTNMCIPPAPNSTPVAWRRAGVMLTSNSGASWTLVNGPNMGLQPRFFTQVTNCNNQTFFRRSGFPIRWEVEYAGNGDIYAVDELRVLYRAPAATGVFSIVGTVAPTAAWGGQAWYDLTLWVDPSDTNMDPTDDVVVVGTVRLFRSSNGGATFAQISDDTVAGSIHDDHHLIVEDPGISGTNRRVFFANDGGIYRTDNIDTVSTGAGWTELNNGLATLQIYGAHHNDATDTLVCGTQDNGALRTVGFAPWTEVMNTTTGTTFGDTGFVECDANNSNIHYLLDIFQDPYRSTDGGQNFVQILDPANALMNSEAGAFGANFIAPSLVLDPNNSNRLLCGINSLWLSTNPQGATVNWTQLFGPRAEPISTVAVAEGNSNAIWVAYNDGLVVRSTNGASFPTVLGGFGQPQIGRVPTRIVIDPNDSSHVFVTFGGFVADNVWETTDNGLNWAPLQNVPMVPVRDLVLHPQDPATIYLATEMGLFETVDGGGLWSSANGPALVSVDDLFISGENLYVATHGRGVFFKCILTPASQVNTGSPCLQGGALTFGPILTSTPPTLGTNVSLQIFFGPPNGIAAVNLGTPGAAPQCGVQFGQFIGQIGPTLILDGAGNSQAVTLPLPISSTFHGVQFTNQAFAISGNQIFLSQGVAWTLGY